MLRVTAPRIATVSLIAPKPQPASQTTREIRWAPIQRVQRRSFFGAPEPLVLQESRVLPYEQKALFDLISDVTNYNEFLPFCTGAEVQTLSAPDETGRRWPATARLDVGYKVFHESYLSRVYCVPYSVVEAIAGPDAKTSIPAAQLQHYSGVNAIGAGHGQAGMRGGGSTGPELFSALRARWSLRSLNSGLGDGNKQVGQGANPRTAVEFFLEAQWNNMTLALLSRQVVPTLANDIVNAFERRARELLE